jgi:hydrogenase/urease accessory protein HupE
LNIRAVRPRLALLAILAGVLGPNTDALGHALQPGYLELRLIEVDTYAVVWKVPAVSGRPMKLEAQLPERCSPRTGAIAAWDGEAHISRWTATCPGGLEGGVIRVEGLEQTSTDVLVRIDFADGANQAHRLTASDPAFTVPVEPSSLDVVQTYTQLGFEHILLGIDHLAFVFALLILAKGGRRTIATVTAFTLAHSLTLAAATLGWVHVPGPPVEAVIALSIVFLAAEIVRGQRGQPGLTERSPWIVAFSFGLLHGFGFAGALSEIGLPRTAIPIALLCFNLGVEFGQLLFIASLLPVFAITRWAARRINLEARPMPWNVWPEAVPPYALGSVAVFWLLQRIAEF